MYVSARTPKAVRMRASTPDPGLFAMLVLATGTLRHWAGPQGWKRPRTLSLSCGSMTSCIWEPTWLQQVKVVKASKKAKRLEYGLVGEHQHGRALGFTPALQRKQEEKRERGRRLSIPQACRIISETLYHHSDTCPGAGDTVDRVLASCTNCWVSSPAQSKLCWAVNTYNPSPWEIKPEGSEIQGLGQS